jgi:hypothetical protein
MVTLADKGLAGREFDALVVGELGVTLARPARAGPGRTGLAGWVGQAVGGAIFDTSKTSLGWNATARTPSKASGSGRRSGCWPWPPGSDSTGRATPRSSAPWSPTTIDPAPSQLTSVIVLAVHGMRLQVPLLVGLVVDPLVPTKEPQESTTVTPAEIIYHRRVRVLDRAGQTSVTEACPPSGSRAPPTTAGPVAPSALGWLRCCPRAAGRR